jgi:hypothetical protein
MTFVHYNGNIVNSQDITLVSYEDLPTKGRVVVKRIGHVDEVVSGVEALNLVMRLCPEALEGKRMKYLRHRWAVHNLVGHPLMQLLSWLHLPSLGIKIHNATIPMPIE